MFLLLTLNIFDIFLSVPIINFEQVNVSWEVMFPKYFLSPFSNFKDEKQEAGITINKVNLDNDNVHPYDGEESKLKNIIVVNNESKLKNIIVVNNGAQILVADKITKHQFTENSNY